MYKANSRARDKPRPSGFRMLGTGSLALERKGNAMVGDVYVNVLVGNVNALVGNFVKDFKFSRVIKIRSFQIELNDYT